MACYRVTFTFNFYLEIRRLNVRNGGAKQWKCSLRSTWPQQVELAVCIGLPLLYFDTQRLCAEDRIFIHCFLLYATVSPVWGHSFAVKCSTPRWFFFLLLHQLLNTKQDSRREFGDLLKRHLSLPCWKYHWLTVMCPLTCFSSLRIAPRQILLCRHSRSHSNWSWRWKAALPDMAVRKRGFRRRVASQTTTLVVPCR